MEINTTAPTIACRTASRFAGLCLGALDQLASQKKNNISHLDAQRHRFSIDCDPKEFLKNLTFLVPEYDYNKLSKVFKNAQILTSEDAINHLGIRKKDSNNFTLVDTVFNWFYFIVYLRENVQPCLSEKLSPIFEGYFIYSFNPKKGSFAVEIIEPKTGTINLLCSDVGSSQSEFSESLLYHIAKNEIIPRVSSKTMDNRGKVGDKHGNSSVPFAVGCLAANDYKSRCIMTCLPPS